MSPNTSTREHVRGWLLASGIAGLAVAIFATAIVLTGPSQSDAAEVKPEIPAFHRQPLDTWREPVTFDHMFRHKRAIEPAAKLR